MMQIDASKGPSIRVDGDSRSRRKVTSRYCGFKGAVDQSRRRFGAPVVFALQLVLASKGPSIRVDGDVRCASHAPRAQGGFKGAVDQSRRR